MAKKSKTQKAKASAARAEKKARAEAQKELEASGVSVAETKKTVTVEKKKSNPVTGFFKKTEVSEAEKAENKKKKKKGKIRTFLSDVRSEMKRVTWPSRTDVLRWSGVVLGALCFFGIYTALLDNAIVMPLLVLISGLGV